MARVTGYPIWLTFEVDKRLWIDGDFDANGEKALLFQQKNIADSSTIQVTSNALPGTLLAWNHTSFQTSLETLLSSENRRDFNSIPEPIKKHPKFTGLARSGQLFSADFSLKSVYASRSTLKTIAQDGKNKELAAIVAFLSQTRPPPLITIYFASMDLEHPKSGMIQWLRSYKTTYSVSILCHQYRHTIPFQIEETKRLSETPNGPLRRRYKFNSIDDYLVRMTYGIIREWECIKYDMEILEISALSGIISFDPVPGSFSVAKTLHSKYFVRFAKIDRQKAKRAISYGDRFLVRLGTEAEAATSQLWLCECIDNKSGDVSGVMTRPEGDLRPVWGPECQRHGSKMPKQAVIQLTGGSKILEAKLRSLSAFQKQLTQSTGHGISLADFNEAKELTRLLLGNDFRKDRNHGLFEYIRPEQEAKITEICETMSADQRKALHRLRGTKDLFSIVTTPSGTGEIAFIMNTVKIFRVMAKRILIVAPMESFINKLATLTSALFPSATVTSFYNYNEEVLGPSDGHWEQTLDLDDRKIEFSTDSLSRRTAEALSVQAKLFSAAKRSTAIFTNVLWRKDAAGAILGHSDIIVAACVAAAEDHLYQNFQPDVVIVAQASYAQEMDVFPVLFGSRSSVKLVLLVGDECQMEPVVHSRARCERYEEQLTLNPFADQMLLSLMERLKCAGYHSIALTENLRMVEKMAQVTSKIFYQSKVADHPYLVALGPPNRSLAESMLRIFQNRFQMDIATPAIVLNVPDSVCVQDPDSCDKASRYNMHHIAATWKFLTSILEEDSRLDTGQISILTQYRSQAQRYRETQNSYKMPKELRDRIMKITIRTVDSFQSGEGRMVIFNAVIAKKREGGPGFLTDRHRLNVATSCARDCFILVIDMEILSSELRGNLRPNYVATAPGQIRAENDPRFLRDLLLEYRNSNSVLDYPIEIDEIPVQSRILNESMLLVVRQGSVFSGRKCHKCNSDGHVGRDCTQPDPEKACFFCKKFGHRKRDCPKYLTSLVAIGQVLDPTKIKYSPEAYMVDMVTRID